MHTCGSGVICFSAAVRGRANLHGWTPIAPGLSNLDLLPPSHRTAVTACLPRPRRLEPSPPKAQCERHRDPLVLSL